MIIFSALAIDMTCPLSHQHALGAQCGVAHMIAGENGVRNIITREKTRVSWYGTHQ